MRIAFVTDTYEDGIAGGMVTAVRFVEALRRRHEVTVIATGAPAPGKVTVPSLMLPLRSHRENRAAFGIPSERKLESILRGHDLVHVQFPFYLGIAAVRVARRLGLPLVTAFHVQPENILYNINLRSPRLSAWLHRWWVRAVFQPSDAVVVPSPFAAERLREYGLTAPAVVISNGARPTRQRPVARPARPTPPYLLLSVGRLAPEKRQDVILEAVARCRHRDEIRLVMAGAGHLERRLRAHAGRLGLAVEFGYVSEERLTELYEQATLFLHASEVELEGMAALDAMAAGLPLLIANSPHSATRAMAAGPEFLFTPGDPDDLAAHIDRLLDTPAMLAAGARRSLERAAQHDFSRSARRLEQVYENVLAQRQPLGAPAAGARRGAA